MNDLSELAQQEITKIVNLVSENQERYLEGMARELFAQRQRATHLHKLYTKLLEEKQKDFDAANLGKKLHEQRKEFVLDLLTMLGQEDLTIKEAREANLLNISPTNFNLSSSPLVSS